MKKMMILVFVVVLIVVGAMFLPQKSEEYDYLRLHIRANSNLSIDQQVKYEIKTMLVDFLTPQLCTVSSKEKAVEIVNDLKPIITKKCDEILLKKGFRYKSNVKVQNEFFPTRTYNNTTLESGFYDAVIVELGEAVGDNWWCVMYPPLCFVNKFENDIQISYKSKIVEWFKSLFN